MSIRQSVKSAVARSPAARRLQLSLWATTVRRDASASLDGRPDTEALRGVLRRVGRRPSDPAAQEWVPRLESHRATLLESKAPIRLTETAWRDASEVEVITVGEACARASKNAPSCLMLFDLIRTMRPQTCLEMGSSVGVSGSYLGAALKANGAGRLFTTEGQPDIAQTARETFRALDLDVVEVTTGMFDDTLPELAARVSPIDFAFIDGHHQEEPTRRYFEVLLPSMSPGGIMLFDDIAWSEGMRRVWAQIRQDSRVDVAVDLTTLGLVRLR